MLKDTYFDRDLYLMRLLLWDCLRFTVLRLMNNVIACESYMSGCCVVGASSFL